MCYVLRALALGLMFTLGAANAYAEAEQQVPYSNRPICNSAKDVEMLTRLVVELGVPPPEAIKFFVGGVGIPRLTCQIPNIGPIAAPSSEITKTLSFRGLDYAYVRKIKIIAVPYVNQETGKSKYMPLRGGDSFKYVVDPNPKLTPFQWKLLCVTCEIAT